MHCFLCPPTVLGPSELMHKAVQQLVTLVMEADSGDITRQAETFFIRRSIIGRLKRSRRQDNHMMWWQFAARAADS